MKIAKGTVVALEYALDLGDGQVIDHSDPSDPLTYLHGEGQIVPGLEQALEGLEAGAHKQVVVPPGDGYGAHDPRGVQAVPRSMFGEIEPKVGIQVTARGPQGDMQLTVVDVQGDTVRVDMNHPLAGKTLHFDVTVRDVRAATADELQHGHAHGPHEHELKFPRQE